MPAWRAIMSDAALAAALPRLLRAAARLPQQHFELFERLYLKGHSEEKVCGDLGLEPEQLQRERSALLRSLMRLG